MRWPLVGGAGFQHLARLMRILMFARSILSPNTNQSVIPNEGRMRGFSLFVCRGPSTEENHLDYRCHEIRDPLPFVCTSLYQRLCLCFAFAARLNHLPWLCAGIKPDHRETSCLRQWIQFESLLFSPHLVWDVDLTPDLGLCGALMFLWTYFSKNLLIQPSMPSYLAFAVLLLANRPPTSTQHSLWVVEKRILLEGSNIQQSSL